jgi:hypothetical protein
LAERKARGTKLGNPRSVSEAAAHGRRVQMAEAERFAAQMLPIVSAIRASGVGSLGGIAAVLNEQGIRSARGGRWHVSSVRNLLARAQRPV